AIRAGCHWVRHFEQLDPARRRVYRCIETLLSMEGAEPYSDSLRTLYGADTFQQAQAMLRGEQRFFGLQAPGMELAGCDMHQRLLAAYRKLNSI
ncbi:MAG: 30S ribosomal protein S12 methylthiotransferase accessory factor YcaO, partial [Sulfuriferula sp.]